MAITTGVTRTVVVDDVVFVFTTPTEVTSHSVADTNGEDLIEVKLTRTSPLVLTWRRGPNLQIHKAKSWSEAAALAKRHAFDLWDKWRDNREGLRREFDALPDYEGHSGKRIGNVILRLTSEGGVFARSLTDTAGTETGQTFTYGEGKILAEGGGFYTDWAEAVAGLGQEYDQYEAEVAALAELEAAFEQLPRA